MRGETDALGESSGHGFSMRGNVRDVAAREPEVQYKGNEKRGAKQRGKGSCGHGLAGGVFARRSVRE